MPEEEICKGLGFILTHGLKAVIPCRVSHKAELNARNCMLVHAILFLKSMGNKQKEGKVLGSNIPFKDTSLTNFLPYRPTHLQEQYFITP